MTPEEKNDLKNSILEEKPDTRLMSIFEIVTEMNRLSQEIIKLQKPVVEAPIKPPQAKDGDFLINNGHCVVCEPVLWLNKEDFAAKSEPTLGNIYDIAKEMSKVVGNNTDRFDGLVAAENNSGIHFPSHCGQILSKKDTFSFACQLLRLSGGKKK